MSRLPTPGRDDGTWGDILNDFLSVEHKADGTLKRAADYDAHIADGTMHRRINDSSTETTSLLSASKIHDLLQGKSDVVHSHTATAVTDFAEAADARISAQKGAANGVASLGGDSKIPASQLPAIAITATAVVASELAQLALTAQAGDVAVRSDENKTYVHNGGSSGTMADWQELLVPVSSVNGQTGAVTLTTSAIAEGTNLYYTEARADARYVRTKKLFHGSEALFLGDSITRANTTYSLDVPQNGMGATQLIVGFAGCRVKYNAGIGGNNTTDVLARFQADAIDKNPAFIYFRLGTNDMSNNDKQVAMTTAKAQYVQIIEGILSAGIPLVIATIPPRGDSQATETRASDGKIVWQAILEWNLWLRYIAETYAIPLVDEWSVLVDPLTTNNWRTGYSADGIHPVGLGPLAMGRKAYEVLSKLNIANPIMPARIVTDTGVLDYGNLIVNGCFKTESLVSPAVPTSWTQSAAMSNGTVTGTAVVAPGVNDTDVAGNWFEIERKTNNASKSTAFQVISSGFGAPGDIMELCGRIQTEDLIADAYFAQVEARFQDITNTDIVSMRALENFICDVNEPNGIYFYAKGPLPTGTNRIRVELAVGGNVSGSVSGKVRFAQVTLRNLTALGMV